MGQKVNPNGFRIGINKDWNSTWVAPKKDIATFLKEDHTIREHIMNTNGGGQNNCKISKITIERTPTRVAVNIFTGEAGRLIGQKGVGIDKLKKDLEKLTGRKAIDINVREIKNFGCDATLVAQSIAEQLERRIAWRRAMKMAIQRAMKDGVKGIKVMVGGRLDGADIARSEHYQQGILPLHTLRSDIDYGFAEAKTTFGIIGIKCWICYGEIKGKTRRSGEVTRASRSERPERPRERSFDKRPPRPPFDPTRRPNTGVQNSGAPTRTVTGGVISGAPRTSFPPRPPRPEGAPRHDGAPRHEGGFRHDAPRPTGAPNGAPRPHHDAPRPPRPENPTQGGNK